MTINAEIHAIKLEGKNEGRYIVWSNFGMVGGTKNELKELAKRVKKYCNMLLDIREDEEKEE